MAADADKFDEKYGMVTDYAALVAKEIKSKMSKHQLSEPEIYTLLSLVCMTRNLECFCCFYAQFIAGLRE